MYPGPVSLDWMDTRALGKLHQYQNIFSVRSRNADRDGSLDPWFVCLVYRPYKSGFCPCLGLVQGFATPLSLERPLLQPCKSDYAYQDAKWWYAYSNHEELSNRWHT